MVPDTFVKELLSRINIVDYISEYVSLKKKGTNYSACCPFHNEKSPSFSVNERKQFYYCFGCGAGGDIISFVRGIKGYDFIEAVTELAEREGLELPSDGKQAEQIDPACYHHMQQAKDFYVSQLKNSDFAISYCKARGITGEVAQNFALGFATEQKSSLYNHLIGKVSLTELQELGLVSKNRAEQDYFFGPRLMFPIRDVRGRTVAFGARALKDGQSPKYLNSPDTKIFHKSNILYGLYEALQKNANVDKFIIVEGYIDVIALQQAGFTGAVAVMGTAFTTNHAKVIFRHAKAIICAFDGDDAGRRAAWKSLVNIIPVLRTGCKLQFLFLPEGEDPDSLIKNQGAEAMQLMLDQAMQWDDYLFTSLRDRCGINSVSEKADFMAQLKELLQTMPKGILRDMVAQKAMDFSGYSPVLQKPKTSSVQAKTKHAPIVLSELRKKPIRQAGAVAYALAILLYDMRLLDLIQPDFCCLPQLKYAGLWQQVVTKLKVEPTINCAMLLHDFAGDELAALQYLLTWSPPEGVDSVMLQAEFAEALAAIQLSSVNMMISELIAKARIAELDSAQKKDLQDLLLLKQRLSDAKI